MRKFTYLDIFGREPLQVAEELLDGLSY